MTSQSLRALALASLILLTSSTPALAGVSKFKKFCEAAMQKGAQAVLDSGLLDTRSMRVLKTLMQADPASYKNSIRRVGTVIEFEDYGYVAAREVPLSLITPIHPIPRTDIVRADIPDFEAHLTSLTTSIRENGFYLGGQEMYQRGAPIVVMIMPDGKVFCMVGHHRVEVMRRLGEESIPARIYMWERIEPRVQRIYSRSYKFPVLYHYYALIPDEI